MKNSLQPFFLKLSLLLALCCTFTLSKAQGVDTAQASLLLKGDLQNHLISKLGGKLGEIKVSERFTAGNSTIQIASRQIPSRLGTVDQITIKITEAGKTQFFSLTQSSEGKLSELRSGQLVAISGGNPLNCVTQLFGAASSCSACKTKILNCITQNNTFLVRVRCLGRNFDGTCISCGVSLVSIVNCLKG